MKERYVSWEDCIKDKEQEETERREEYNLDKIAQSEQGYYEIEEQPSSDEQIEMWLEEEFSITRNVHRDIKGRLAKGSMVATIDGKTGFLVLDKNGMPYLALHREKRFEYALGKYNRTYKEELPTITSHVCRHTYCTNRVRDGVSPKTLQCLVGHEDIATTLGYYTHFNYEDVEKEMRELEEKLRKEI